MPTMITPVRGLLLGALSAALLGGCEKIKDIKDTVDGLTERVVIEGMYLGVAPSNEDLNLEAAGFGGARLVVFLADAAEVSEIENAPITGQSVRFLSPGNGGSQPVPEDGSGRYSLGQDDGLDYVDNEVISVSFDYDDEARQVSGDAVGAADLSAVDQIHEASTALSIDLSGQGFDNALVVVFEVEGADITYSNEPSEINELYEFTHPDGLGLGESDEPDDLVVNIPPEAFPGEGVFALGVAGVVVSGPDDMDGVNTALSTMMVGKFRFLKVCTNDFELLCADTQ